LFLKNGVIYTKSSAGLGIEIIDQLSALPELLLVHVGPLGLDPDGLLLVLEQVGHLFVQIDVDFLFKSLQSLLFKVFVLYLG